MAKQKAARAPGGAKAKLSGKTTSAARPAKKPRPTKQAAAPRVKAAASRFVSDLVVRGDAQERDTQGNVPHSATHVIQKRNPDGTAEVKRIRFKAF